MTVYLAHNYKAAVWLKQWVVPLVTQAGHTVLCRWLDPINEEGKTQEQIALMGIEDINKASTVMFFADQHGDTPGRGKYFELGFAVRAGKRCIVVDYDGKQDDCVFYHLPNIRYTKDLVTAIKLI